MPKRQREDAFAIEARRAGTLRGPLTRTAQRERPALVLQRKAAVVIALKPPDEMGPAART